MPRKLKKTDPDPKPEILPMNILQGSILVCYEDGFVSFGPVTNSAEFGDFLFVAWDCWWLVIPETWQLREVINKDMLLLMRGVKAVKHTPKHPEFSGEPVVTELVRRVFTFRDFTTELGQEVRVMAEARPDRIVIIYPPGIEVRPDQFFRPLDWYVLLHEFM